MPNDGSMNKQNVFSSPDIMALSVPLWVFDIDHGRVSWANHAACQLWNVDCLDDLRDRDLDADMSAPFAARLKDYQAAFEHSGHLFEEDWTLYPGGVACSYRIKLKAHPLPDGRMGILCEALAQHKL